MFLRKFRAYLRLTQGKLLVWGVFLIPYVAVMLFYSGALPKWVQAQIQRWIYQSSLSLEGLLPTPIPRLGATQVTPPHTNPELLTVGYFFTSYLWACILVESFGTIVGSRQRKSHAQTRKNTRR